MPRRLFPILGLLLLASTLAGPALARTRIVAYRSSGKQAGVVYLTHSLSPGHRYRVEVRSAGHQSFLGYGIEDYTYVYHHRLYTNSKSLTLDGTTPHSFVISQPTNHRLSGWILATTIQLKKRRGLTVRFIDLGRHK